MYYAGCDIGSLTAKAVILDDNGIVSSSLIRVKGTALSSASAVMDRALENAGIRMDDIALCCSTGYGRFDLPFSDMHLTEISCHGIGAHWLNNSVRTIIDIGGQDCKVISLDGRGLVAGFVMNDKCAAGTGRNLEILARALNTTIEELGPLALQGSRSLSIENTCSIFMELEVLRMYYKKTPIPDIALSISEAVARRVMALTRSVPVNESVCITGGVSKNSAVVSMLETMMDKKFVALSHDPQLAGAIGAALYARQKSAREHVR